MALPFFHTSQVSKTRQNQKRSRFSLYLFFVPQKRMPLQSLTQIITTMKNLILTGKITAASSFIIGSILLAIYLYFENPNHLETTGITFIVIAFWVNLILWIILVISAILKPEYRVEILKTCGIMLLNIPVTFGYFLLVLYALDNHF